MGYNGSKGRVHIEGFCYLSMSVEVFKPFEVTDRKLIVSPFLAY